MTFAQSARQYGNFTNTENGAVALKSTESALLDLFATVGSLRSKDADFVANAFQMALAEEKLLATKLMFYARNVRGGLGERETFRRMLASLAKTNPEIVVKNLELIPLFGRYDDLYTLVGTRAEENMWNLIRRTIAEDVRNMYDKKPVSLCAKWLKSPNTSSPKSVKLGKLTAQKLDLTERQYRKMLSALREYIDLIEVKMSAKEWDGIDYSRVPSRAMKNYRDAFKKHDESGFGKFMEKVERGEAEIKAQTLYPYDILMGAGLTYNGYGRGGCFTIKADNVLEAQWKALPNYVEGENNILIMADTSGSMTSEGGRPIATAIGLAVYFAERNKGAYKDLFLTFSESPRFVNLRGTTLKSKIECIESIVENTDLAKAFDLILNVAVQNNVPASEMPKSLVIITDMQFDSCVEQARRGGMETFHTSMKKRFAEKGYEMPTVIYWNVASRGEAFQVNKDANNVMMVSGQATSVFKSVLTNIGRTPYDFMVETLNDKVYDCVTV